MRILIIEDNHYMVSKIISALPDRFPEHVDLITVVPELTQANDLFEHNDYHWNLLLIDHDLPGGGNGTWFLKNYKDRFNYIIAISSIPENNKRLMENGAHDQVLKMEKGFEKIIIKKIKQYEKKL